MKKIVNNILKAIDENNNEIIHVYPNCTEETNYIIQQKFPQKMINEYNKNTKQIIQTELYFRDLVKLEYNDTIKYFSKKSNYEYIDNILIMKYKIDIIDENQFPKLLTYHNVITKTINILKLQTIDVMFIMNENKTMQICFVIKNVIESKNNPSYKKMLINELEQYQDFFE